LSLITTSTDHADLADADLVIEAVFEDRDVKKTVTESIEAQIRPSTVLASNTSTMPITGLAKNSKRPKNFIGIHFFSPVDKMMLVEIILGKRHRRQGAGRGARLCCARSRRRRSSSTTPAASTSTVACFAT
jgi:3-hydroxyacyl-CoA dehydrogenase/enoyl-CoA hydratase/3-hydroxybutyryl-CoA epimerase